MLLIMLFILCIIIGVFLQKKYESHYTVSTLEILGMIFTWTSVAALIFSLIIIVGYKINSNAVKQKYEQRYTGIMYKIESGIYEDDFKINDKDLVTEISEWNQDIVYYKSMQRNIWVGVFIPNIYDEFETIDYGLIKKR